jgi:hypothetical protein
MIAACAVAVVIAALLVERLMAMDDRKPPSHPWLEQ